MLLVKITTKTSYQNWRFLRYRARIKDYESLWKAIIQKALFAQGMFGGFVRDWFHSNFHTRDLLILATLYTHQNNKSFFNPLATLAHGLWRVKQLKSRGLFRLVTFLGLYNCTAGATSWRLPSHGTYIFFKALKYIVICWYFACLMVLEIN